MANAPNPILFLSYGIDQATFQKMIQTKPYAFIPKPFQTISLERNINTVLKYIDWEKQIEVLTYKSPSIHNSLLTFFQKGGVLIPDKNS